MKHNWLNDPRIQELGGAVYDLDDRRRLLIERCFTQITKDLEERGIVEGIVLVPMIVTLSDTPEAMLLGHPDGNAISITIGMVDRIESYVHRALLNPDFLSTYLPAPMGTELTPERQDFGSHLVLHMLDFIIHHEIAHDVRDHLGLLQDERGIAELGEVLALNAIDAGDELYRMIEFDADVEALDLQIHEFAKLADLADWPDHEMEDAFFLHMLAMLLVCQILDQAHEPVTAFETRAHPAPVHRAIIYSDTMVTSFADHHPQDRTWFDNIHDQAWYEASIAALSHGFPEGRWRGLQMTDARFDLLDLLRPDIIEFREMTARRT